MLIITLTFILSLTIMANTVIESLCIAEFQPVKEAVQRAPSVTPLG